MGAVIRIAIAFQVECLKSLRIGVVLLGPTLLCVAMLAASARYSLGESTTVRHLYLADSLPLVNNLLGFALVLLFSANLIAGERAGGTLRQLLLRPIGRLEWFCAKYLAALAYALWLMLPAVLTAWGRAALAGPMSGIAFGGEVIYSELNMLRALALALGLSLLTTSAGAAVALAVSTCARSTASAFGVVLGGWLTLDAVKYPLGIERFVFTTHLDTGWQLYAARCEGFDIDWMPQAHWAALVSVATIGLSLAFGAWRMRRMNLTAS